MVELDVDDICSRFIAIANELGDVPAGIAFTGSAKLNFAIALLTLAMEHFDGIAMLTERGRCGAAAALVRPLIDAGTRGSWLALVASDAEAEAFAANDKATDRRTMLEGLATVTEIDHTAFQTDPTVWKHLHGMTHGGFNQASHRLREGVLSGTYRPEFIDGMLKHALAVGAWTTVVLSMVVGVQDGKKQVADILTRHAWYSTPSGKADVAADRPLDR